MLDRYSIGTTVCLSILSSFVIIVSPPHAFVQSVGIPLDKLQAFLHISQEILFKPNINSTDSKPCLLLAGLLVLPIKFTQLICVSARIVHDVTAQEGLRKSVEGIIDCQSEE